MYSRTIDFNTEPILSEIDKVIKNGLNELLSEHLNRYELLEKTHQAIMNLPSVLNELNQQPCNIYNSKPHFQEKEKEKDTDFNSKSMMLFTEDLIKKELDKQYESIMPLFEKMLTKIENLSKEVNELKNKNSKDILDLTVSTGQIAVEKENIRLEIEETSEFELENDVYEEPEDTVEEQDDIAEEQDDDTVEEQDDDTVDEEEDIAEEQDDDTVDEEEDIAEEQDEEEVGEEDEALVEDEEVQDEAESDDAVQEEDDVETENSEEESDEVVEEGESDEVVEEEKTNEVVEEEEEEELFEIDIDDITYCTNNEENGFIYQLSEDGDVGTKVGYFKDGEPFFYADEN